MGNASRRRGADTSYQRDDEGDVARCRLAPGAQEHLGHVDARADAPVEVPVECRSLNEHLLHGRDARDIPWAVITSFFAQQGE